MSKLDPKQKRLAIAVGIGALLGLIVLLRNRGGGGGGGGGTTTPVTPADPSAAGMPGSSTFADNGSALGELNTTLTGLSAQLDQLPGAVASQVAQTMPAPGDTTSPAAPDGTATSGAPPAVTVNIGAGVGGKSTKSATARGSKPVSGHPGLRVNTQAGNRRRGQAYTTKKLGHGVTEHIYGGGRPPVVVKHKR